MKRKQNGITLLPLADVKAGSSLTQEEIELITSFRKLSDEGKSFASAFMVRFADQCPRNDQPRLQLVPGGKQS
jgi:hypothetical protein